MAGWRGRSGSFSAAAASVAAAGLLPASFGRCCRAALLKSAHPGGGTSHAATPPSCSGLSRRCVGFRRFHASAELRRPAGTHYDTLGVPPTASAQQIRAAYFDKVRKHHPDKPGGSAEAMKRINDAFSVLGSDDSRAAYDESLRSGSAAGGGWGSTADAARRRREAPPAQGTRMAQPLYAAFTHLPPTRAAAGARLEAWLRSLWWLPSDAGPGGAVRVTSFAARYTPVVVSAMAAETHWSGSTQHTVWVRINSNTRVPLTTRRTGSGVHEAVYRDVFALADADLPPPTMQLLQQLDAADWGFGQATMDSSPQPGVQASRRSDVSELIRQQVLRQAYRDAEFDMQQQLGGLSEDFHAHANLRLLSEQLLMMPIMMVSYEYGGKTYEAVINAATGAVRGTRPYATHKIGLAALAALAGLLGLLWLANASQQRHAEEEARRRRRGGGGSGGWQ